MPYDNNYNRIARFICIILITNQKKDSRANHLAVIGPIHLEFSIVVGPAMAHVWPIAT
jgi:hypothetical protein